jgi:hypothetical protein
MADVRRRISMRVVKTILILLQLMVAVVTSGATKGETAQDKQGTNGDEVQTEPARASGPVLVFGHKGGNLRPYTVAIYADGRVKALSGHPPLKTERLAVEKLRELLSKARDKSFWEAGAGEAQGQPRLPDYGFVFVKVRPTSSKRLIVHSGAQVGPLGEFYALLSDLIFTAP